MKIMLEPTAFMPVRAHETDAGLDLRSRWHTLIPAHGSAEFDTGVHIELPHGWYGKIESKSGLNVKHGVVSCGGVIDEGYTGSIVVKLYNLGAFSYVIHAGDKIAQLVIMPYVAPDLELVDKLEETERGDNGFGSTGK
jgi:dUTP pyrophosphatase